MGWEFHGSPFIDIKLGLQRWPNGSKKSTPSTWLWYKNPKREAGWWLGHPSEKYERQLGCLATQYMGKQNGNQTTIQEV